MARVMRRGFSGVVNKQHFPRASRVVLRLMGGRYGDFRESPEIDARATEISRCLLEGTPFTGSTQTD